MKPRLFSTLRVLRQGHENPLGLPRSGAPPQFPRRQRGLPEKRRINDVKKVIAVSSAKGGVGKSTIAANLALSFAASGLRAGILDADIFGPSIPTLLNLSGEPRLSQNNQLIPLSNYGLKSMSMGYLVPDSSPIAWRGAMLQKALQQLLHEVAWGGLDILVLDLPPGTGDVQLTIAQQIVLDGAVVVSTPQSLSVKDTVRGIQLFRKMDVPILGIVQNMSLYHCSNCGHEEHLFGRDALTKAANEAGVEIIGDVPLHPRISADVEMGKPTVVADPKGEQAKVFEGIASLVRASLGL